MPNSATLAAFVDTATKCFATAFTSPPNPRSAQWYGGSDRNAYIHRAWMRRGLPDSAFTEFNYQSANESPTGLYSFNVYLVKNSKRSTLLGSTTANVKEFLPDRMKIDTHLSETSRHGWISPKEMRASVSLANLYGKPESGVHALQIEISRALYLDEGRMAKTAGVRSSNFLREAPAGGPPACVFPVASGSRTG